MVRSQFGLWSAKWLVYRTLFGRLDRVKKYFWFILALQIYKVYTYLVFDPSRGRLLEAFYLVHRYIDDIADGDAENEWTGLQRLKYIEAKKSFSLNPRKPADPIEFLIVYYQDISSRRNENFTTSAICIIDSMLFDARRLGSRRVYSRRELEKNYHLLDEMGTILPMLRLAGEDVCRLGHLSNLSKAVRIYYNLRDLHDDLSKGFINVPREDIASFRLDLRLPLCESKSLGAWSRRQARIALRLLEDHRLTRLIHPFKNFTSLILWSVYERKAKSYFLREMTEYAK